MKKLKSLLVSLVFALVMCFNGNFNRCCGSIKLKTKQN